MIPTFLPRRRPCFECSLSLRYVNGKGYYAVIVNVNGNDEYMHKWCAENRENEYFLEYVEDVLDAKQKRRDRGYA